MIVKLGHVHLRVYRKDCAPETNNDNGENRK
jgi:hypothetical protein